MDRNNKRYYIIIFLTVSFISYYLYIHFPVIGDGFDYWHMATSINIEKSGSIRDVRANAGYYVLATMVSQITSIPYDNIPTLPLLAAPILLLIAVLLKELMGNTTDSSSLIISLVMLVFITRFENRSDFTFWGHGLGFLLFLLCIVLCLKEDNRVKRSICLIVVIISVNYVSYKFTFLTILFLLLLQIVEWYKDFRINRKIIQSRFINLFLIGIIYVLTFNKLFYQSFIPKMRMASEYTMSGIEKLILTFTTNSNSLDSLSSFYYRTPIDIRISNTLWLLLIVIFMLLIIFYYLKKIKNQFLSSKDAVYLALLLSSIALLFIYSHLGIFDIRLIVFSVIIGVVVLYINKKNKKKLIITILLLLLPLNMYIAIRNIENNFYSGMRDIISLKYLSASTEWYMNYLTYNSSNISESNLTDVFTGGYISKEIAKKSDNLEGVPGIFSHDDMLFLYKSEVKQNKNSAYVINCQLDRVLADNWETFNTWVNYKLLLDSNIFINLLYNDENVAIYRNKAVY